MVINEELFWKSLFLCAPDSETCFTTRQVVRSYRRNPSSSNIISFMVSEIWILFIIIKLCLFVAFL